MRSLVALLLVLSLSGCVAEEEAPEDPLIRVCPQWIQGPAVEGSASVQNGTATLELAPTRNGTLVGEHQGFPLDLYVLTVDTTAPVRVRAATGDGRDLLVRDASAPEPDSRLSIEVEERGEVALYLTAVAHGTDPDPSAVRLTLESAGSADVTVTGAAWYRVCGAVGLEAERR